jgi:ATP-binding protein involved in chromosome partitioning
MKPIPVPYLIRRVDDGAAVEIQWEEHGHLARYPARDLRLACRCAACQEEMSGRPILDPGSVPPDVRAAELHLVGGYAVQFTWSDGHATGIYPWDYLLGICPCERCTAARSGGA